MSDVTRILRQIEAGDPSAAEDLLPLVYDELRKLAAARMAQESPDHTLQATALVHEAYIRLVDVEVVRHWNSRGHFFAAAAEAMRRLLIEQARRDRSRKAGGKRRREPLGELAEAASPPPWDLLDLHDALMEFEAVDPEKAELVKLRYFAGLSMEEAAGALGVSLATAKRHWRYARAWLYGRIRGSRGRDETPLISRNS